LEGQLDREAERSELSAVGAAIELILSKTSCGTVVRAASSLLRIHLLTSSIFAGVAQTGWKSSSCA
jgi:hypothetical protein